MLRLAFDFIITWRETRTRPNAYLICMYMNFHTFRMKIHIRAGVFFISADAS